MNYFSRVKSVIDRYKIIGEEILSDGTLLIGKAPHIAPQAWLHNIYPVLNTEEVLEIENKLLLTIPTSYKNFLLNHSNGLCLFVDTLSLYGLRKKIGRSIENAWQPYSIFTPNTIERIKGAAPSHFFIGSYNYDGSLLYIDNNTNQVHRCSRKSVTPLNTWDSFEEMIVSETERIALLFDERGVERDEDSPTTPLQKIGK